jgi:hypothetical protein
VGLEDERWFCRYHRVLSRAVSGPCCDPALVRSPSG